MVSNIWFDRETGKLTCNIEDDRYSILSVGADVDEATEVDTSQKLASTDRRSPANILVSTFSDELAMNTNRQARIFGANDDNAWEMDIAGFGRTFPHAYGPAGTPDFNNHPTFSPAADELTLDFAKALIHAEDIGGDEITDYLSISFSSTDYVGHIFGNSSLEAEDNLPDTPLVRAALRNFNPKRSGDILILFRSHCFINHFNGEVMACNHGGPWTYDTFVPVIFAVAGLKPMDAYRRVETVDVARTLAAWPRTKPPSGAVGRVLPEVLDQRREPQ